MVIDRFIQELKKKSLTTFVKLLESNETGRTLLFLFKLFALLLVIILGLDGAFWSTIPKLFGDGFSSAP